jgi:hypothetical protein
MFPFGLFSGVWNLVANVPEHSVCSNFIGGWVLHTHPPMKMEQTECSGTLATKLHTPENNPKENIRPSKQGESLKAEY